MSTATDNVLQNREHPIQTFKNKIINGGFDVWQRGVSFTPSSTEYVADRWLVRGTSGTGGTHTLSYQNEVNRGNILTSIIASFTSYYAIYQRVENLSQFSGKTLTFSTEFAGGASIITDFYLLIYANYGTGGSTGETLASPTLNSNGEATFTIPDLSAKTFGDGSYLSIGIISIGTPADQTLKFWNIQLEEGSVATAFEQRPVGTELALCQRYFQSFYFSIYNHIDLSNSYLSTGFCRVYYPFPTQMRAVPTVTHTDVTAHTSIGTETPVISGQRYGIDIRTSGGAIRTLTATVSNKMTADAEL